MTRLVFRNPETTYTVLRRAPERAVRVKPAGNAPLSGDASEGEASTAAQQASFIEEDTLPQPITVVGDFSSVEVGQELW